MQSDFLWFPFILSQFFNFIDWNLFNCIASGWFNCFTLIWFNCFDHSKFFTRSYTIIFLVVIVRILKILPTIFLYPILFCGVTSSLLTLMFVTFSKCKVLSYRYSARFLNYLAKTKRYIWFLHSHIISLPQALPNERWIYILLCTLVNSLNGRRV